MPCRILIVTSIFPPDHGGPARYVPAIADALPNQDIEITKVITGSDLLDADDSAYSYPVLRIRRGIFRPFRMLKTVLTIVRESRDVDCVYLNGMVLEGIIACKIMRKRRTVIKVVGDLIWEKWQLTGLQNLTIDEFQEHDLPFSWRFLRKLQSLYTSRADRVIVPSRYLGSIVGGWGVTPERIRVVYNSISAERFAPTTTKDPEFDVIVVGRLVPWKRVGDVIRAASENGWKTLIVGSGPEESALKQIAADSEAHQLITFHGEAAGQDIPGLMRKAKILVLNSTYEGLPHVVLEAMASGLPVVASDVGGTGEAIADGETGFLFPPDRADLMIKKIRALLADPEKRRQFGESGRARILEQFGFEKMATETAQILKS